MRFISSISLKSLVAGGAVVATLGAGAIAAHASVTEDDFGQAVKQEVAACKASAARLGEHGIGKCISTWIAANHPQDQDEPSPEPSESPRPEPSESPRPHPSLSPRPHPSESPDGDERGEDEHEARPSPAPTGLHPIAFPTPTSGHRR